MSQPSREKREQALVRDALTMSIALDISIDEARTTLLDGKTIDEYDYLSDQDIQRIWTNVEARIKAS